MTPAELLDALRVHRVDRLFGVPDSLLKEFCAHASATLPPSSHVITANEGSAVGMAIGHFLGTGDPALVYLQNSGLGNAVNPLTSLADPEVYGVPMVLLIGWRGEPGVPDEPQHVKQGRISPSLLDVLEVPFAVLDRGSDPDATVAGLVSAMTDRPGPVALLVRAGAFEAIGQPQVAEGRSLALGREEAIGVVARALPADAVVVATTGHISRELFEVRRRLGGSAVDFLTVGGMGHASSIALGLAMARPGRTVACLDGDGAVLMHLGALPVIGGVGATNLVHVVLNNGVHESVGGQPTVGFDIDLPAIALGSGYRSAVRVDTRAELEAALAEVGTTSGPALIEARVRRGARADLGRPSSTPREHLAALAAAIRS